jgi:hypothetical protein
MDWYSYAVGRDGYLPYFAHLIHPYDEHGVLYVPPGNGTKQTRQVISKEQLRKKAPPFPIPKELEKAYKRVVVALRNGEDEILTPLRETPNHMLLVSQEDLNAPRIHEKIVKLSSFSKDKNMDFLFQKPQQNPYLQARQTYNRNGKIATLREKVTNLMRALEGLKDLETQDFQISKVIVDNKAGDNKDMNRKERAIQSSNIQVETSLQKRTNPPAAISQEKVARHARGLDSKTFRFDRSSARFRDWNPDVKVAQRAGISIRYSSRTNEVRCPELNISSRYVSGSRGYQGPRVHLTSGGSIRSSASGSVAQSGSSSSGSSSQSGSSSSKASSSGSKGGSSGGKVGVVKK